MRGLATLLLGLLITTVGGRAIAPPDELFRDDFEHGLGAWELSGPPGVSLHDSGDASHGRVMTLTPNGDVLALIRGSEHWVGARLEGDMRFPSAVDNYLGFVYRHARVNDREDFGLIYVKGDGDYVQANPHRDFNVSRLIYPELRATLGSDAQTSTGVWRRFALEVVGRTAHLYVGAASTPVLTFDTFENERGAFGLQPRSVGGSVWVDNVTARSITQLSYLGPPQPTITYAAKSLLTEWSVAGPFERSRDQLAVQPQHAPAQWSRVTTDSRGAVVTGRVVDYHGPRTVAYFRTAVASPAAARATLEMSTADDLAVWLNGVFLGFYARQDAAWFDLGVNPAHAGRRVPLALRPGNNDVVVRVRGGVYASGGFFARLLREGGR